MTTAARKAPDFLRKSVIYQLFLRAFTREGTLKEAEKMLPHLSDLGIDLIYLCPVTLADDDADLAFWSPRQKASGMDNPQNPYRVKDYFALDPEYGSAADLKEFVQAAHALGIRVMLDLVYYHCGPKANLIEEHPDFVRRDPEGRICNGEWCFPELDFSNPALREYLWGNMEYFVREFQVDGYRIDVASPKIPVDFFEEAHRRLEVLNPDIFLLAESQHPDNQRSAYDLEYDHGSCSILRRIFLENASPALLQQDRLRLETEFPSGARFMSFIENHDTANNDYENRLERKLGHRGKDAMLTILFALKEIPMLYNGEEAADDNRHSLWANRFHGKNLTIKWENLRMPFGERRYRLLRHLIHLHRTESAFYEGSVEWLGGDEVFALCRTGESGRFLCAVNPRGEVRTLETPLPSGGSWNPDAVVLREGVCAVQNGSCLQLTLEPYGYLITKL